MPYICKECLKTASFGYTKPPEYCKTHKKEDMVNVINKRCKEYGCKKGALSKTDLCSSHGGGIRCKEKGCNKGAIGAHFCSLHGGGYICIEDGCESSAVGKTDFCRKHGGGKKCKKDGCESSAASKTDFCVYHGGGKRCKEYSCKNSAIGKTDFCSSHGGGKRCKQDGCKSSAVGKTDFCITHGGGKRCIEYGCNNSSLGKSDFCAYHGGGNRCKEYGCKNGAAGKTNFCIKHGGGNRCKEYGCKNGAAGKTDFCIKHGGGNRCPNCIGWIDSRCGSLKYDGYCATCFKVVFPEDERSKVVYRHTKEIRVRNEINAHFEGFIHDKPLYTRNCDCTHRRRIDHRKLIGNTILAIETDEFAHCGYDPLDEEIRYDDLYMIHSGKWIFIRFNPDGGKVDLEDKLEVLIREIEEQIRRIESEENEGLLDVIKLYY